MNKKKTIASIIAVLTIFIVASRFPNKKNAASEETAKQTTAVSTKSAAQSKSLMQQNQYPATVVGDQEIKITAKSAGTIVVAPANIGSIVTIGSLLAKIDDTGSLEIGDEGLRNLQVQQSENAVSQAKKAYKLAKEVHDSVRKSDTASEAEKDTAKAQVAITKLQYENALLGLAGSVDNHLMTSPISGIIAAKEVSVGDSVSIGQPIATISKSSNIKIQFYVDQQQRESLVSGQQIFATDSDGLATAFLIKNIAIIADQTTKRFLIEAYPQKPGVPALLSGTIVNVSIEKNIQPTKAENFILPLSAISIGQNESYIFVVDGKVAKKVAVKIENVNGETAEISADISPETLIIVDGNKLVHDGEIVSVTN